jgi:ankyrin repeat protein
MADAIRSLPPLQLKQLSRFGNTAEEIVTRLARDEDTKCLTPLHLACIKGHAEAAAALMSFGVNPFAMVGGWRAWLGLRSKQQKFWCVRFKRAAVEQLRKVVFVGCETALQS